MSENFDTVVNFSIYKKLKFEKFWRTKTQNFKALTIQNKENKHLLGFF